MPKKIDWDVVSQEFRTIKAQDKTKTQSAIINALAKRYGKSYTTIYNRIRKPIVARPSNGRPSRVASRPVHRNGDKQLQQARAVSNTIFADVVALLQSKREKIDRVIQALNAEA